MQPWITTLATYGGTVCALITIRPSMVRGSKNRSLMRALLILISVSLALMIVFTTRDGDIFGIFLSVVMISYVVYLIRISIL